MSFLKMSSRAGTHKLVFEIQKRQDWQNTPFKLDKRIVYLNKQKQEKSSKVGKIVFFQWYLGHVCCKCPKRIVFGVLLFQKGVQFAWAKNKFRATRRGRLPGGVPLSLDHCLPQTFNEARGGGGGVWC